jgi:hypothetical protein
VVASAVGKDTKDFVQLISISLILGKSKMKGVLPSWILFKPTRGILYIS